MADGFAQPLRPSMSTTTLRNCRHLDRIAGLAHRLHAQTQMNERGHAPAFGIDMDNADHEEWLSDLTADLMGLVHQFEQLGDHAPGERHHDARGPL